MEFDTFDNKTIIIVGLIVCGLASLFLGYENVASMIVGALGGVLTAKKYYEYKDSKNNEVEDDSNENI